MSQIIINVVSTINHCAQEIVTVNKVFVVKSAIKTVVIMVIRIEQH